jgi:hypothetical protein
LSDSFLTASLGDSGLPVASSVCIALVTSPNVQ